VVDRPAREVVGLLVGQVVPGVDFMKLFRPEFSGKTQKEPNFILWLVAF
jgi:hypothetical protein